MADNNNAIGHASWSENSSDRGVPGDSTGKEVCTRSWYAYYTIVMRPPCESLASASAQIMEEACDNPAVGYSQVSIDGKGRDSFYHEAHKVGDTAKRGVLTVPCNCDCSSLANACVCLGSRRCNDVDDIPYIGASTSGLAGELKKHGYTDVTSTVGTSSPKLLQRGDVLIKPKAPGVTGHAAMVLLNGSAIDNPQYGTEGSMTTLSSVAYSMGSLYEEQVEKKDATVREVCYLDSKFEPSIKSSKIRLSVINYTNLLGNLFTQYISKNISNMFNDVGVNYDGVENGNAKAVLKLLMGYKGMTVGGAIGIIANMHYESRFRANAKGDKDKVTGVYTSFGLCQWHLGRGDKMKEHCLKYNGVKWDNNMDGQVDYLVSVDLMKNYKSTWEVVSGALNTIEASKEVAHYFCVHFEVPADTANEANRRAYGVDSSLKQNVVEYYWNQLVFVPGSAKEV